MRAGVVEGLLCDLSLSSRRDVAVLGHALDLGELSARISDAAAVFSADQAGLDDLREFSRQIAAWLTTRP